MHDIFIDFFLLILLLTCYNLHYAGSVLKLLINFHETVV
jgi:hypothetical protein